MVRRGEACSTGPTLQAGEQSRPVWWTDAALRSSVAVRHVALRCLAEAGDASHEQCSAGAAPRGAGPPEKKRRGGVWVGLCRTRRPPAAARPWPALPERDVVSCRSRGPKALRGIGEALDWATSSGPSAIPSHRCAEPVIGLSAVLSLSKLFLRESFALGICHQSSTSSWFHDILQPSRSGHYSYGKLQSSETPISTSCMTFIRDSPL